MHLTEIFMTFFLKCYLDLAQFHYGLHDSEGFNLVTVLLKV